MFGTASLLGGPADTAAQTSFINYLQGAWATFAKNPSSGLSSSSGSYQWPTYSQNAQTLVQLGLNNSVGANLAYPAVADALCPVADLTIAAYATLTATLASLGNIASIF